MTPRLRALRLIDRAVGLEIMLIVAGTALLFGGAVAWMKPALAIAAFALAMTTLVRAALIGRWGLLRSPLTVLGLLALGLAALQLTPLPGRIAARLSPSARTVHALGVLPELAQADDPTLTLPEPVADRTPATLDRPATLRWLVGSMACLAVFVACSHYADRAGHSAVVWGSVVAAFFVGTVFGVAQIVGNVSGLYGTIEPGSGRPLAPTLADVATAPGATALRPIGEGGATGGGPAVERPEKALLFGTMLGGPGAYLALGALGLPLALGMALHLLAPRGSREPLRVRLHASGKTGLAIALVGMTLTSSGLVGFVAGPVLAIPYALAVAMIGLMTARPTGLRWLGVGLTVVCLGALGGGVTLGELRAADGTREVASLTGSAHAWKEAIRTGKQFPLVGSGLGTYPTLAAYRKTTDVTPTTAGSSLLQWGVESGAAGLILLGLGAVWCLVRLPAALARVGSGDKVLAYMLVGTAVCFVGVSALHWTVEVMAVALAACAVAGTVNRWLAGGTDLFVEGA